jgi:BirA family biotin operon repressor/biotin-[acetyl-CoA-carboxylase] ligase
MMQKQIDDQLLLRELERLCDAGELPRAEVGLPDDLLAQLGFTVGPDFVRLPVELELLDADRIRAEMSEQARSWVQQINVLAVAGSTNSLLLDQSRTTSIDGVVTTSELQIAGRGRRGRPWLSPFGQNLAISLGAHLPIPPAEMGGFSLCIGLAVMDALEGSGAQSVSLKWPNDVLLEGKKIAGILVELSSHDSGTQVVVGVGVNVRMPAATSGHIEQPVADLSGVNPPVSRNLLTARLISTVLDYVRGFSAAGFEPLRAAFDAHHAFQDEPCRLLLAGEEVSGIVRGVTGNGELLLESAGGISAYSSGEVSLRARAQ